VQWYRVGIGVRDWAGNQCVMCKGMVMLVGCEGWKESKRVAFQGFGLFEVLGC